MTKAVWLLLLLAAPWVAAKELYRYKDSAGLLVTSDMLSPEAAVNGYDAVNEQGRVLKTLRPQHLPPQGSEQSEQDQYLLSSFSQVDEISVLKRRKLELLARDILHLQNNIKGLDAREELILQEAVNMEMAGETVSQSILDRLAKIKKSRHEVLQLLEERQEDQRTTSALYQYYEQRFAELLNQQTSAP
ncbi:MAG: hypothetical protein P8M77_05095 [Porticoccaceae bacterium]|nr:hypothetical protein [Porticoccaceae bacterium]